jgi:hypothetical protein
MSRLLASFALALALIAPSAFGQEQHTASATSIVLPSLPFSDPGYTANGSFTVTVVNGAGCGTGVYTVNAAPIAGSGPGGSIPPITTVTTYIGFSAGNFLFDAAGAGQYTVTVTETGPCDPPVNPVVFVATVPNRSTQYTAVTGTITSPTLPFGAPGYVANGLFNVTVTDGDCAGAYYTVGAEPISGSGPGASTPPVAVPIAYLGFPQGNFLFNNAGPGGYTVTVTRECIPATDPVTFTVLVPNRAVQPTVTVPVDHPLALLMAGLALAGFALRRLRHR